MGPIVLETPVDSDAAWLVQLANASGTVGGFSSGDTFECVVWEGSDSAALFSPTAAWVDTLNGQASITVGASQTAALAPGVYPLELTVITAAGSLRLPAASCWLSLTSSPGSDTLPPVYGSYDDLETYGGGAWLPTLRRAEGLSNFMQERGKARQWLDTMIVRKFRPWSGRTIHWSDTSIVGPPDARNPVIRDYLSADYTAGVALPNGFTLSAGQTVLMVTDRIREMIACKALEYICRQRMTFAETDVYPSRAAYFARQANDLACRTSVELDVNQDGFPDYAFPLGVVNLR
jgi:hypothetical protein